MKNPNPTPMKAWMARASTEEQQALAETLKSSRAMLYQYASGHREASAVRAGEIEEITAALNKASKGRLPRVYRTDLCSACAACPHARKCSAPAAEFELKA